MASVSPAPRTPTRSNEGVLYFTFAGREELIVLFVGSTVVSRGWWNVWPAPSAAVARSRGRPDDRSSRAAQRPDRHRAGHQRGRRPEGAQSAWQTLGRLLSSGGLSQGDCRTPVRCWLLSVIRGADVLPRSPDAIGVGGGSPSRRRRPDGAEVPRGLPSAIVPTGFFPQREGVAGRTDVMPVAPGSRCRRPTCGAGSRRAGGRGRPWRAWRRGVPRPASPRPSRETSGRRGSS